ncbi:MAG: AmmeMemoRadiSam system protein A [Halanaerobiales bacterium]
MFTEDSIVTIARETVEEYVKKGTIKEINDNELSPELKKQAGVFVTLKKESNLRGCIGTVQPTQPNIAREIVKNAVNAAAHDPRFPAVREDELEYLSYSVDVLGQKEKVEDKTDLDPQKYGVVVKKGTRTGLLLPDLEGVDTIEKQLEIARKKAGIKETGNFEIYRFPVIRYKE